ncbi:MAG: aquaporin family protein [Planctomycetes bacterium]|jgi:glycerol uptake facilitator protein|nr:aquaporin family protein [Planctomycetota bacterium]
MSAYIAEFFGTALLILFGNGVVANVVLSKTKGHNSGWIVISAGWGLAVFVGAFCANKYSGAHLNPAVTLAAVITGKLESNMALGYVIAQLLGAMLGSLLVFVFYREHFLATNDQDAKLACFCTSPNIRNLGQSLICEAIGTYALILPILLMVSPSLVPVTSDEPTNKLGLGALELLPVGLLVFGIGLSLGGTTGYAINPVRDFGPRLMHAILPIPGKRDSDWGYAWVPIVGPLLGAALAAVTYLALSDLSPLK